MSDINLIEYYREHTKERASMLQEIGMQHPATRYIEALEEWVKQLEEDCKDYRQEIIDTFVRAW